MTRQYHDRFFSDVRFTAASVLALFVLGWWEVEEAFLLVPVVAPFWSNHDRVRRFVPPVRPPLRGSPGSRSERRSG